MRKRIILFVLPIIALVVMTIAFSLSALSSHAAGTSHHQSKSFYTISTPAVSSSVGGMQPDGFFSR